MKVYVGGALSDEARVQRLMRTCVDYGHELTLDWTTLAIGQAKSEQRSPASAMRDAVLACDVFVLADHADIRGGLIELGIAVGAGKPAFICAAARPSVFFALPNVRRLAHDHDLIEALRSI
jgi:hypothetical protein